MAARTFSSLFKRSKGVIIGMVHVRALPGSPKHSLPMNEIVDIALKEAEIYAECGMDGIIVENMHDLPYLCWNNIGPEIVASMSSIASKVKSAFSSLPIGIQILKAGNKQSLAVAHASGCEFVRAECFTFSHISDAGWVNASAGELMRYRKQIGADDIMVFTDIKKKHSSHSVTSDLNVVEAGEASEFFLSDGIIVTGLKTGQAASQKDLEDLQRIVDIPVLIGSGVTVDNLPSFVNASGLIVGSHFKYGGKWSHDLERKKVEQFMKKVKDIRN